MSAELVTAAQQQYGDTTLPAGTSLDTKAPLVFQAVAPVIITATADASWSFNDRATPASERPVPPLPPPRAIAA
ncbi:MAG: hypothetical protein QM760_00490 [Nibricoccus sp.]